MGVRCWAWTAASETARNEQLEQRSESPGRVLSFPENQLAPRSRQRVPVTVVDERGSAAHEGAPSTTCACSRRSITNGVTHLMPIPMQTFGSLDSACRGCNLVRDDIVPVCEGMRHQVVVGDLKERADRGRLPAVAPSATGRSLALQPAAKDVAGHTNRSGGSEPRPGIALVRCEVHGAIDPESLSRSTAVSLEAGAAKVRSTADRRGRSPGFGRRAWRGSRGVRGVQVRARRRRGVDRPPTSRESPDHQALRGRFAARGAPGSNQGRRRAVLSSNVHQSMAKQ